MAIDERKQNDEGGDSPPSEGQNNPWTTSWLGSNTPIARQSRQRLNLGREGLDDLRQMVVALEGMLESESYMESMTAETREEMEWGRDYGRWVTEDVEDEVPEPPVPPERLTSRNGMERWSERVQRWLQETEEVLTETEDPPPFGKCPNCTVEAIGYDVGGPAGEVCPICGAELEEVGYS